MACAKRALEQQKELIWPDAHHEWNHLRWQNFKSVADYNHVVHKICSKLNYVRKNQTGGGKLFLPCLRVLQIVLSGE
jgi:hypothetical protein